MVAWRGVIQWSHREAGPSSGYRGYPSAHLAPSGMRPTLRRPRPVSRWRRSPLVVAAPVLPPPPRRRRGAGLARHHQRLPQLAGAGRRDPAGRGGLPDDRVRVLDRQELPGPRHLDGQGQRQRRPTDEAEPEVLVDALHHAREHLTTEQALALLRWLTRDYGTDETVHAPRRHAARSFIIFALNPDGMRYDLTGDPYRAWRKNRQRDAAGQRHVHGPQPQLRLPVGLLRRVVGQAGRSITYRGPSAVLRARDAGPARLRQQPRGRTASSRSGPTSRSTPTASSSCGRTATPRPTSRPT